VSDPTHNDPFLDRLGAHLDRAASDGPRANWRPAAAASLVLVALIAIVATVLGTQQRPAEAISVTVVGQVVEVEIRSPITDLDVPVRKLEEAGVAASVVEVPASSELVGRITAITSTSAASDVRFEGDAVTFFSVLVGDQLTIEVGRPASSEERFLATDSAAACSRWRNLTVAATRNEIEASFEQVRWQLFDGSMIADIDIPPESSFVQDLIPSDQSSAIVVLSLERDALPASPSCQPDE